MKIPRSKNGQRGTGVSPVCWALLAFIAVAVTAKIRAQDVGADTVIDDPLPPRVVLRDNLAYDAHPRQKLDLYLPVGHVEKPRALIVFIHGGGWMKGGKADGRRLAFRFVAQGYVVACIDYRFSTDAIFPAQLEDCKAALRWLRSNAERYGIDRDHVGVIGVSAGGHLAALLGAANSSHLYETGVEMGYSSGVQAACDFFGPVDLMRLYDDAKKVGAPQADEVTKLVGGDPHKAAVPAHAANPATMADGQAAPILIIHGDQDTVVPLEHSRILYDAMVAKGVRSHLHIIHGAGHTGPAFVTPEINAMVDEFFIQALRPDEAKHEPKPAEITEN